MVTVKELPPAVCFFQLKRVNYQPDRTAGRVRSPDRPHKAHWKLRPNLDSALSAFFRLGDPLSVPYRSGPRFPVRQKLLYPAFKRGATEDNDPVSLITRAL